MSYAQCEFCEEHTPTVKMRLQISMKVCDDCFNETYKYCKECREYDFIENISKWICANCANKYI